METLTLFHLDDCPYCHNARRALAELAEENPAYGTVSVDWIEESRHPELIQGYEYYYVPSIFAGKKKLYEAHPGESYAECKVKAKAALDAVLR